MRVPSDAVLAPSTHPVRRYQVWLLLAIIAVIVLLVVLQGAADLFTNYLWYRAVGFDDVWRMMTATRIELSVFFTGVFFAACWVSLLVVDRIAPRALFMAPEQDLVRHYQAVVGRHRFAVRTAVSIVIALIVGGGTGSQWQNWMLFLHGGHFGIKDPQFHKDIGYFVFRLPFLSFLVGWTQVSLVVLALVCAAAYYMNGGLRFSGPSPRVDPRATSHFSLIFAAFALVRAAGYFYVDRYALDVSPNGLFQGAGYTAVHVRLPALNLLVVVALVTFVMFIYNVYSRGWILPVVAGGLWLLVAVAVGVVFPWAVQALKVGPSQSTLELPYLSRNIAATRSAYGLNGVSQIPYQGAHDATAGIVSNDASSLKNVDLWDPSVSSETFQVLQRKAGFYSINGLSLDRYELSSGPSKPAKLTPVVVGVREISASNLNRTTWVNTHLVYTHGYGVVMAPANTTGSNPEFVLSGVPQQRSSSAPIVTNPAIYYGLGESGYVVVDSAQDEFDYQSSSGPVMSRYAGSGGIKIGSIWEKAAFALRFHDFNLFVSRLVTPTSRIMFNQDVRTRVHNVAPFLQVDANPYPVVADGQIDWIVDAYTTTSYYPYSQDASTPGLSAASGLSGTFNYVRNSVIAVVNAYSGKVTLYSVDQSDPILRAWERTFPGMFHPLSQMSRTLQQHLKYPQNLLSIEATIFGKYHLPPSEASNFYNNSAAWQVALTGTGSAATVVQPVYQLLELPGQSSPTFNAFLPLVPIGGGRAQNLSAFVVANCTAADYGKLTAFEVPQGSNVVAGPAIVNSSIAAQALVSEKTTLLDQQGSRAIFGPTLMIPIDDSLLYVRALFVSSSSNAIPQFQYVVAVWGNQIAIARTLLGSGGALAQVIGPAVAAVGVSAPIDISASISAEVQEAASLQAQALSALKRGDFAVFGKDVAGVGSLLGDVKTQLAKLAAEKPKSTSSVRGHAGAVRVHAVSPASPTATNRGAGDLVGGA